MRKSTFISAVAAGPLVAGAALAMAGTASATVAPPAIVSATSAHRSCSVTWHDRVVKGSGGNVQAWVSDMNPAGCGTVWSKALCRIGRTGGRTVIGKPNITAASGGTSKAQCKSSETVAAGWVVVHKDGVTTAHKVF